MSKRLQFALFAYALAACSICGSQSTSSLRPRVIELTADRDSRYRQGHKTSPTIEVFAGEPLTLRVAAVRAKEVARDGSVHGLALLDKNSKVVAGWSFFLHSGLQDLTVTAPSEPGRYTVVCTVICSGAHDGMGFTLLVIDPKTSAKGLK